MTPQSFSYYSKDREPSYEMLANMARYFGVSSDYLLGISASPTPEIGELLKEIPLSSNALLFLSTSPPDMVRLVDALLSAPNFGAFVESFQQYIETSFISLNEILDSAAPLLDHLSRKMTDEEFVALLERWKWDSVCQELEVLYKQIREQFAPGGGGDGNS